MKAYEVGDWVLGSDSREFDLLVRFAVGSWVRSYRVADASYHVVLHNPGGFGTQQASYRYVRRITKAEGREFLAGRRELVAELRERRQPGGLSIGEEIRACLRSTSCITPCTP